MFQFIASFAVVLAVILSSSAALAQVAFPIEPPIYTPSLGNAFIYVESAAGDYIGQGRTFRLDSIDGEFGVRRRPISTGISPGVVDTLEVMFLSSERWSLNLRSPKGRRLRPGYYYGAERAHIASPLKPGLDFSGGGRGCNTLVGVFNVLQLSVNSFNGAARVAIDFEQHCEGSANPPLRGHVRINSNVPVVPGPIVP